MLRGDICPFSPDGSEQKSPNRKNYTTGEVGAVRSLRDHLFSICTESSEATAHAGHRPLFITGAQIGCVTAVSLDSPLSCL